MSIIDVNDLTCDYGRGRGVFDLTFSVEPGEVFGFLGPNASGKTTTIRHLMGYAKPASGTCQIEGRDCFQSAAVIQETLGYLPGDIYLFPDMSGKAFLSFMAKYRGMKHTGRIKELVERFELDIRQPIRRMSKGAKQKLALVCAFMHDPNILILDEPTASLDLLMQQAFIDLILEEKKKKKTILMSSHRFSEVEKTCDRIAILKKGHLKTVSSLEELRQTERRVYVITLENAEAAQALCRENIHVLEADGRIVKVAVFRDLRNLLSILVNYPVSTLDNVGQSLEEIFMHYYGGEDA
ncbi:MAG: ABC transporter ATP-binding protein [Eubacteriales bacterium]|nr:ABC transporter ATP-binding protein [Eubacteriales bacterium]